MVELSPAGGKSRASRVVAAPVEMEGNRHIKDEQAARAKGGLSPFMSQ